MNNQAAWLPEAKAQLKVDAAEEAKAGPHEVVIKNSAWAINQIDWKIQAMGFMVKSYPNIIGASVAGEVVDVGEGVSGIMKGQRVMGHCISLGTGASKQGGFQLYSVLPDVTVAPIPDSLTFGRAAVLPLPLSTATASLYQTDFLGLPLPRNGAQPTGQTILVWGGSSSVGSCAIQLAAASGLKVVTTASKKNFAAVTALGAEYVFDYESETVIDDVVASLKNTKFAGAIDTISKPPTMKASAEIVHRVGGIKKLVTMIPPPEDLPEDVEAKGVFALSIALKEKSIAEAIYHKFIPGALQSGQFQAKPDPVLIQGGLAAIQEGMNRAKQGTSAGKVVVTL